MKKAPVDNMYHLSLSRIRPLPIILAAALTSCARPALAPTLSPSTAAPTVEPTGAPSAIPSLPPSPTPTLEPTVTPLPEAALSTEVFYLIPPTVQHVTETSATVFFELSGPANGQLLYRSQGNPAEGGAVPLDPGSARHLLTLDGLTPETRYEYIVHLGTGETGPTEPTFDGARWGPTSFRTGPCGEPLRFGVIGDSGFGEEVTFRLGELMAGYDLAFVIHVGDVVYRIYEDANPFESYALKFYAPFAPLLRQMPIYPVVGNHDVEEAAFWEGSPFYYRAFPPFADPAFAPSDYEGRRGWYAFAHGDVQFVLLDTQIFFGEPGRAEQDTWLRQRLADERYRITIPVFHVPMYTSGMHPSDTVVVRMNWEELFTASRIPLTLAGHDHNYERLIVNGITHIVSGGGSAGLYGMGEQHPNSQFFVQQSHFVLVELFHDHIVLQAIGVDGAVIDGEEAPLE